MSKIPGKQLIWSNVANSNLNLHVGFHVNGGNLPDRPWSGEEVEHSFVNSHLEPIPGVSSYAPKNNIRIYLMLKFGLN